jgi:hypothetical protein
MNVELLFLFEVRLDGEELDSGALPLCICVPTQNNQRPNRLKVEINHSLDAPDLL